MQPSNPNTHKHDLDPNQIARSVFDGDNEAIRTVVASSTEVSIELSHTDGDSVYSIPRQTDAVVCEIDPNTTPNANLLQTDCTEYSKACICIVGGTSSVRVQVSPVESGDIFVDVCTTSDPCKVIDCLAKRIRIVLGSCLAPATVYLTLGS